MALGMLSMAVISACLACGGRGREAVKTLRRSESLADVSEDGSRNELKVFSRLLQAGTPAAAFSAPGRAIPIARGDTASHSSPVAGLLRVPKLVRTRCPAHKIHCSEEAGPLKRVWERYNKANEEHPMATKMATSAFLASVGDLVAQFLEGASSVALKRLLCLATVNVLYIVPWLSFMYAINERICTKIVGKERGTWKSTACLLAFDQLCIAVIGIFGFFWAFALITSLAGAPGAPVPAAIYSHTIAEIKVKYVDTLITNWKVWVAPQIFNFAVVPLALRVAFANCVALVWNVVISLIANK